ncbi:hypothetical protein [Cellulomonas fengjieae]|uniref:Uncharacterized protein n=1 Tax=Cellulomonas fengjieae TaxID=2819978 RepID=A0ABS3SG68_9CELL|nr:hypothetical protein [Cellulomonas fengjieae]MBO3084744.1 hypothetical protein [Cellulomonas fengjieae]
MNRASHIALAWVVPGFANYGLDIPGSEVAAAETRSGSSGVDASSSAPPLQIE